MKRHWTQYITTAANTSEQVFDFTTNDDFRGYNLEDVFVGITTAGVLITLYASGTLFSSVDATRFAAGDQVLKIDESIPAKVPLRIGIKDIAGNAQTNVPVTIGINVPT